MKILLINKFLYPNGGSETYIFKLGDYLQKKGHEVQYFGMEHQGRCVGNRVNAYTSNMDFHGENKLAQIVYPIKTIYSQEARKKIRLVLDDFQPDVCHLNNFNYQLTPSIILEIVKWKKQTGKNCKIVYTAHDGQLVCPNHMLRNPIQHTNCERCIKGQFYHCAAEKCIHGSRMKSILGSMEAYFWKWKKVYQYIDTIICCSDFMKRELDNNPMFVSRTVTLHNFVEDIDCQDVQKENYVLYFGRYSEEKGIDLLLEVCKQLPDIPFIFAGGGPLENQINEVKNIKNVGYKKGEELYNIIRKAKIYVCPSTCFDNCPFSVMESTLCGTPVLGADIGGIPELIEDRKTGELFRANDVNELKNKLQNLWENQKVLEEYAFNCKHSQYESMESYYLKLLNLYQ